MRAKQNDKSVFPLLGSRPKLCAPLPQIRKRLMVSDKGHLEWKKMYFKLSRCYPHREQYSDTLHLCTHCHILFWRVACFSFSFFFFKKEKELLILIVAHVSFRRTQTIRARRTTQKAAPCRSPLKILSTFSTSDTPPPPKKTKDELYILCIKMYNIIFV